MKPTNKYRYRVVSVWGEVPAQVSDAVGQPDRYLVYPEYRGRKSTQDLANLETAEIVGGWSMEYAGKRPV